MSVTVDSSAAFPERYTVPGQGMPRGRRVVRPSGRVGVERGSRRSDSRQRPAGFVSYERARVPRSRAPHGRARTQVEFPTMLAGLLCSALVALGLFGLAQLRSNPTVPGATAVVQVRGGESLGQLAARVAPQARVDQVVERIVELNALEGAGVHAGQSLVVPVSSAG